MSSPDASDWTGLRDGRPLVVVCDHQHTDPLCPECVADLATVLADVSGLQVQLSVARTKQSTFVNHGTIGVDSGEARVVLPWSESASKAGRRLARELNQCVRACGFTGDPWADSMADLITRHLPTLARRPDGPEWARRISTAVAAAHRAVDSPPSPWYYGPCPDCHRDIYAERIDREDVAGVVVCGAPGCPYAARLDDHRLAQLDAGDDRWLTVGELVGAITSAGETVTRDQINGWIRREGLAREVRVDIRLGVRSEAYVYRLGDVRRMAQQAEARRIQGVA